MVRFFPSAAASGVRRKYPWQASVETELFVAQGKDCFRIMPTRTFSQSALMIRGLAVSLLSPFESENDAKSEIADEDEGIENGHERGSGWWDGGILRG